MSDKNAARRTKVQLYVSGNMKAPDDINKHVQSVTYTDSKEKNSDDLQIVFDDREKKWLGNWIEIYPSPSPYGTNRHKTVSFISGVHFLRRYTIGRSSEIMLSYSSNLTLAVSPVTFITVPIRTRFSISPTSSS